MTQFGEPINVGVFVSSDNTHTEQTCPWHEPPSSAHADAMDEAEPETDTASPEAIPSNSGKKLGRKLIGAGIDPPAANKVVVRYAAGSKVAFKQAGKPSSVRLYAPDQAVDYEYPLQYAPHHLIPGNESLKGSMILRFMGDDTVISKYEAPAASRIKKGQTIGFDVNAHTNGVWLPSPYALSNSNNWPSEAGLDVIVKTLGEQTAQVTAAFKMVYAAAAIEASGGRQFHMRHEQYSYKVQEILNAMADKMSVFVPQCPVTKPEKDALLPAPAGLLNRLHGLAKRMNTLLTGKVWHAPFFADEANNRYYVYVNVASDVSHLKLM